ncbi:hypothetical protein E2C01_019257 [Portunus trituberculatus]|uniref:Uncharacterized protein n=1 Tax=Portunus trituberculatus TaxID=210409 RepID=A0A5B7DXS4_PORTR|nr:hypothetical protein [Portunus trituberculatus]
MVVVVLSLSIASPSSAPIPRSIASSHSLCPALHQPLATFLQATGERRSWRVLLKYMPPL